MLGNAAQELCAYDRLISLVERFSYIFIRGTERTRWLVRLRKGVLEAFGCWAGALRNDSDLVVETSHAGAYSRLPVKKNKGEEKEKGLISKFLLLCPNCYKLRKQLERS